MEKKYRGSATATFVQWLTFLPFPSIQNSALGKVNLSIMVGASQSCRG